MLFFSSHFFIRVARCPFNFLHQLNECQNFISYYTFYTVTLSLSLSFPSPDSSLTASALSIYSSISSSLFFVFYFDSSSLFVLSAQFYFIATSFPFLQFNFNSYLCFYIFAWNSFHSLISCISFYSLFSIILGNFLFSTIRSEIQFSSIWFFQQNIFFAVHLYFSKFLKSWAEWWTRWNELNA